MNGNRRARLRERQRDAQRTIELRAQQGHSCGDCRHRDRRHGTITCGLGDDGEWYQPTTLDNLCWRWEEK